MRSLYLACAPGHGHVVSVDVPRRGHQLCTHVVVQETGDGGAAVALVCWVKLIPSVRIGLGREAECKCEELRI